MLVITGINIKLVIKKKSIEFTSFLYLRRLSRFGQDLHYCQGLSLHPFTAG